MAKKIKKISELFKWWYVYRGTNKTKKEVYHGVSIAVIDRINKKHCVGATKKLAHWDCEEDNIVWELMSQHKTQTKASEASHKHEKTYTKRGYTILKTAGI